MKNLGFTLIEFLIYIAIVAAVLVFFTGFLWNIVFGNIKETAYQEIQQNARFALTKMTQEIKKATAINSPNPGSSSSVLSLAMAAPVANPTVIDLADGKLQITKGASQSQKITSDLVKVSNLQFTNLSYPNTPGTIRVEMTIERLNPSSRIEYLATLDLKSSISLFWGGAAP